MGRIIGIDLGTTNSCAAYRTEEGAIKIIPYKGGDYTVPSIFAIDDKGQELVGYEAKRQWQLNPTKTIYGAKRLVGRAFSSDVVERMQRYVSYKIEPSKSGGVEIPIGSQRLSLEQVQAKILTKIKQVAEAYLQEPVERAVVTVPAYFSDRQRQATKEAGTLAGLEVVRIINEPTAAALAFGLGKGLDQTVAIYDLGGGTFDISIIEIRDRTFEVKATGGDVFLGGIDFDNAIIEHVLKEFASKHAVDLRTDPIAMQRIKDMAERAKVDLSSRTDVPFSIPFITMTSDGKPLDINTVLTRQLLETLAKPLIEATLEACGRVLRDADKEIDQIKEVLLVGGQTRMPAIHDAITRYFKRQPSKGVHPDEAVAVGAAIFASSLEGETANAVQLLDVIPMAIGIQRADGGIHRLFARNASVPNQKAFTFTTSSQDQDSLIMRIYQGDSDAAKDNELLGEFTFSGIRKGPAGSVNVEVVFTLSHDGILTLEAKDKDTGTVMKQTVRVSVQQS
ncbi:MAG: Hsp70 family protein [Deltaproteobacteria bacterium]|nr:Hsp70 family protein [Deltaproteobacteria bacterium]